MFFSLFLLLIPLFLNDTCYRWFIMDIQNLAI